MIRKHIVEVWCEEELDNVCIAVHKVVVDGVEVEGVELQQDHMGFSTQWTIDKNIVMSDSQEDV